MSGFFSKLFGGSKTSEAGKKGASSTVAMVEEIMGGLIEKSGLDLTYDVKTNGDAENEEINIEVKGADEAFLTEKEGALLDALQLFIKRVLQHQLPDARVNVNFDSNGYREESNKSLLELADKLKERALEQGRSVYLRALPPKDRKVIHQYLASDERVRSRSVGDGLYKKIKIYPVKDAAAEESQENEESDEHEARGNRGPGPGPRRGPGRNSSRGPGPGRAPAPANDHHDEDPDDNRGNRITNHR